MSFIGEEPMSTDEVVDEDDVIIISDDEEKQQCEVVDQNDIADDCLIIEDDDQQSSGGGGSMHRTDSPQPSTSAEYVDGCEYNNQCFHQSCRISITRKLSAVNLSIC